MQVELTQIQSWIRTLGTSGMTIVVALAWRHLAGEFKSIQAKLDAQADRTAVFIGTLQLLEVRLHPDKAELITESFKQMSEVKRAAAAQL